MLRNVAIYVVASAFVLGPAESYADESPQNDSGGAATSSAPAAPTRETAAAARSEAESTNANEERVSLNRVLEYAMANAPAIALGKAGVQVGRAEVEAASPLLPSDPVLSGSAGRRWQTNSGSGVDYSVGVEQEFDIAGRRGAQRRAARSELSARKAELLSAKWFVHQKVHGAYHQALVARDRSEAARRVLSFTERLVKVARQRLAAGETSPLPVRLAEAELAQARQGVLLADSEYHSFRLDLARVAGWAEPKLLTPIGKLDAPETPPSADSLLRRAQREQPALRAARERLSAAESRFSAAKRRSWPNPTLGVLYENEAQLGPAPQQILSGTLSVPIPVWVGSAPDRARARAGIAEAEAELSASASTLGAQIVQARQRADSGAERARLYGTEILPTLETNLGLLQKAFELGEIDILQVMVAQERFLRTQQDALQAFADYYEAWAELEAIVGGELHGSGRTEAERENPETK